MTRYAGTRLGRQELLGEMVEERADALWTRDMLEACRRRLRPAVAAHRGRDRSACIVASRAPTLAASSPPALMLTGMCMCSEDASLSAARPAKWARVAVALYHAREPTILSQK